MDNVPRGSSGSRGRSSSVFSRLGLENSGLSSGGSTRSERYTRPSQERSTWHKVTVSACFTVVAYVFQYWLHHRSKVVHFIAKSG